MKNLDSLVSSKMIPLLEKAKEDGAETIWDRTEKMKAQCGFGLQGLCCRNCAMGPCRISPVPGKGVKKGLCGATADVIVSRNFVFILQNRGLLRVVCCPLFPGDACLDRLASGSSSQAESSCLPSP